MAAIVKKIEIIKQKILKLKEKYIKVTKQNKKQSIKTAYVIFRSMEGKVRT
jgi:hypothetical protein